MASARKDQNPKALAGRGGKSPWPTGARWRVSRKRVKPESSGNMWRFCDTTGINHPVLSLHHSSATRRGAARAVRRGAARRDTTRHDTTRQRPTTNGRRRRRQRQRRSGWAVGQRRAVAAACGLWDVGRMCFFICFVKFKKKLDFVPSKPGSWARTALPTAPLFLILGWG